MTPAQQVALIYAAFTLVMLVLVATGIVPRTRWNTDASANNIGRVKMHDLAYYTKTGQSALGVHAQERIECFLKWIMFLSVVGVVVMKTKWFFRQSELIGHAAEVLVAGDDGFDRAVYLHDEAARTYLGSAYKGVFDNLDLEGMKRALRSRFWIARVLVTINWIAIRKVPKA